MSEGEGIAVAELSFAKPEAKVVKDEATISEFVTEQCNKYFMENIPVETIKELPPTCNLLFKFNPSNIF